MTVRSRCPVRIDFAGGWTDVPAYAAAEGGAVVNVAIDLSVHVECVQGDGAIRLHAEDLGESITAQTPAGLVYDGKLDLHKAALNILPVTGGIEVVTRSDVPAGSGLGASGALDVALLAALARCRGEAYHPTELAEFGFELEAGELGLEGGRQDQYAAALGGWNELSFGEGEAAVIPIGVSIEHASGLAAMTVLAYTGESHFSSRTHARVWSAYHAGRSDIVDALRTMRDLAPEAADAMRAADWNRLAKVVGANWAQQQRLDPTISTPAVHNIEQAMRAAGAWGIKATGAGAGGCLVAIAPREAVPDVERAVAEAGARVLPVAFDFDGVRVWEEGDAADAPA